MSRKCDVANVKVASGNKVSHSNRKTKRKFNPNLHAVTLLSDTLKQKIRLRVAVRTLKTIEFKGGLDNFLLSQSARKLTEKALNLKNKIKKKLVALETSQENA
ncbi:MAG: 50S ribosomal protein L28 [Rickettsiales bacterium]|nr:50S ribosomal protein L28 [Rickettsiales bacterium]